MKGASVQFTENEAVGGNYKGSLFKGLFKDRKNLLEGYPAVKKGVAFPEPCLNYGSSMYSFKTTDVVDKVSCKYEGKEFQARYKKDTGKWDLSVKAPVCPGLIGLLKYEERGTGVPSYVFGLDMVNSSLALSAKVNPATGMVKQSYMYDFGSIAKGVKLAGDCKCSMFDLGNLLNSQWNIGLSYASGAGLTAMALNQNKLVTLNHSLSIDKYTSAILEVCGAAGATKGGSSITCGVGRQLDKEHQLRLRVNDKGQVQACLKKEFSPSLSLLIGTCIDVTASQSILKMPSFGFKVVTKC